MALVVLKKSSAHHEDIQNKLRGWMCMKLNGTLVLVVEIHFTTNKCIAHTELVIVHVDVHVCAVMHHCLQP